MNNFIPLNAKKILSSIADETLRKTLHIDIFDSIGSTNQYLHKAAVPEGMLPICLAEQQTAGRGRIQRTWYSPFGENIYFSCRWQFQRPASEIEALSLVVALAVVEMLQTVVTQNTVQIKWPNDVLLDGKKIAGVLIDITANSTIHCEVVIGIGINVNMVHSDWHSVQMALQASVDRNSLISKLIILLHNYLKQFEQSGFEHFQTLWQRFDYLYGKKIKLANGKQELSGKMHGINQMGQLLLYHNHQNQAFSAGDVSIKKR